MKKGIVLLVVLVLALSLRAFGFQNEPEGFRDLKWGDPIPEGMVFEEERHKLKEYIRPGDELTIEGLAIYRIIYSFYEDQFCKVSLFLKSRYSFLVLKRVCTDRFGQLFFEPSIDEALSWDSKTRKVFLGYIPSLGYCCLYLSDETLIEKSEKEEEEEKNLQKGVGW